MGRRRVILIPVFSSVTRQSSLERFSSLEFTSDLTKKTADYSIELPWTPDGKCETGLSKPSIAQVHWTDHIMRDEVRGVIGSTPKRQQLEVARALALRIQRQGQRKT
jgi:hypothetical protein